MVIRGSFVRFYNDFMKLFVQMFIAEPNQARWFGFVSLPDANPESPSFPRSFSTFHDKLSTADRPIERVSGERNTSRIALNIILERKCFRVVEF